LNVLRPTVAVGRFIVFAAHALHENPQWAEHFAAGDEEDLEGFVQEVRRYYPFFPVIGGRVRHPFIWRGHAFKTNDWVLLDLYGTDHDQGVWRQPHEFRPERFRAWQGDPNSLIPQGGGPYDTGHRCPGEGITIALMTQAVRMLTLEMSYSVPPQDLAIRLDRMPALPNGGFVVANIRQIAGR
jgi:fatty-acid peroxygenase